MHRVRTYAKEMSIEEAVDKAINECIKEDILREFLEKNRAEAKKMSIYEYDQEEHIRLEREDAFEDGSRARLVSQVQRKLERGDSVEKIADDLVEEIEIIRGIVKELQKTVN